MLPLHGLVLLEVIASPNLPNRNEGVSTLIICCLGLDKITLQSGRLVLWFWFRSLLNISRDVTVKPSLKSACDIKLFGIFSYLIPHDTAVNWLLLKKMSYHNFSSITELTVESPNVKVVLFDHFSYFPLRHYVITSLRHSTHFLSRRFFFHFLFLNYFVMFFIVSNSFIIIALFL